MRTVGRRQFLRRIGALGAACALWDGGVAFGVVPVRGNYRKLLVLIELKGGNDGLNTLVPYTDPAYYTLRPRLAIARDTVLQLDDRCGLNPALAPLMPLWREKRLAVLRGVGYPSPNLSHFRSIEIWDTASQSDEYLQSGWLTRTFGVAPVPRDFAADGVAIGSNDLGPLAGEGIRALALNDTEQFVRQSRLANAEGHATNHALEHILKIETDIQQAALDLATSFAFRTDFPRGPFGNAVRTACQVIANRAGIAVVRVTLGGFDTHANQLPIQGRLLGDLAAGIAAFKSALDELGRWQDTLLVTYSEFGRRPRENMNGGTDHGTASVQFATGGRVVGGLHGREPSLATLDAEGNPAFAVDFRSVYATVLERWWSIPSAAPLQGQFPLLDFVAA